MKKLRHLLLSLALVIGLSAPYVPSLAPLVDSVVSAETAVQSPVKVKDMAGKEIVLDQPAQKIVALLPSDAEILFAIGAGDQIAAIGNYVDYPAEEIKDLPVVTSGQDMNAEEILALEPELVVLTTMGQTEDTVKQLEDAGIPVMITDSSNSIEEVYQNIENLGIISGHEEEAQALIDEMEATFQEYEDKAKDKEGAKVYYEISPLEFGLWTAGKGTFMDEMGQMLKLENIFGDLEAWKEVSQEDVLDRNPDYIFTTSMPSEDQSPVDEILNREGWQDVTAVKEQQVFAADNSAFTRPGPRLMEAIKFLYESVYGE